MILIHVVGGQMGGKAIAINPTHILAVYPQNDGSNRIVFDEGIPNVTGSCEVSVTDPLEYFLKSEG